MIQDDGLDPRRLVGEDPYNASALGRLLAYRVGPHYGSRVWLCRLGLGRRPARRTCRTLPELFTRAVSYEDPRLFRDVDGRPRLIVTMYGKDGEGDYTRIAVCDPDGGDPQLLDWPRRDRVEKNWLVFARSGERWLDYGLRGGWHRVGLLGADGAVTRTYRSPWHYPWDHGDVRGGSPPVLHDGLWWTFFHSTRWDERAHYFYKDYALGVAAFEDRPPFRVVGMSPAPLWQPPSSQIVVKKYVMRVVFPGSAEMLRGSWRIVCGVNDTSVTRLRVRHADLVRSMVW